MGKVGKTPMLKKEGATEGLKKKTKKFKPHGLKFENNKALKQLGAVTVNQRKRKRFDKGVEVEADGIKTKYHKKLWAKRNKDYEIAISTATRTEILLNEEQGCLIPDDGERTDEITQNEILAQVDIAAAAKHFEIQLENFGPYRPRYTRNGRCLLLAGAKGHITAFDWITKHLKTETNVMEGISDATFLHSEAMYAVAQKNYVHVYDIQGTELHCVKKLYNVNRMEFLPYHMLLATANDNGFLSWLDVSIGMIKSQFNSKQGSIRLMSQNYGTGVVYTGASNGIVNIWSPTVREPLAYVKCHKTPLSALASDTKGKEFITCALDRTVKVWDSRNLGKTVHEFKLRSIPYEVDISQKGLYAIASEGVCEIYKPHEATGDFPRPYMRYATSGRSTGIKFCPYEDVLGIATQTNFCSILIPGSGEANFDHFEANPFQSKTQRRETEVRNLLDKIPMELISLDPESILKVNVPSVKDRIEMKKKIIFAKPPKVDFTPRMKKKSKNSSKAKRKEIMQQEVVREFKKTVAPFKKLLQQEKLKNKGAPQPQNKPQENVLDRFKRKGKLNT